MKRLFIAALLAGSAASAQTMLDQEQRLIQIHSMLLDLPAVEAPGAYAPWQLSVAVELITVPTIDGQTGGRRQLTASDQTPVFPRPRVALGLPAPQDFRIFVGASYIPPVEVANISTHYLGAEAGIAYMPGVLTIGFRAHALYAVSQSPVTDPNLRDTLHTGEFGGDLSAGYQIDAGFLSLTPYVGAGVTYLSGRFRVTSDGDLLSSDYTSLVATAGLRLVPGKHWEGVAELGWYPDRLLHPNFRIAYLF